MVAINFTDTQCTTILRAMGILFRAGTIESEEYLAICNPILNRVRDADKPVWRTLPDSIQDQLVMGQIEEMQDCIKDLAHAELDGCVMSDLCEMYGFDEELVEHLCYADPDEVAEHVVYSQVDLDALQAFGMFTAQWEPTQLAERWLKEYIGKTIDSDKAKEFVA